MTTRTVLAGETSWYFSPEVPPPTVADRSQAILRLRLVDETTGLPPVLAVAAATTLPGATARASDGGLVGVVGQPSVAFYAPTIATARVDLTVTAAGFLAITLDEAVGAQPGYPDAFAAIDLGDVMLHRAPTWLSGRMVSRSTGPLSGGTVRVSGVWYADAKFTHAKHTTVKCEDCHGGAPKSTQSSDVLIPGIANCRTCHGGAKAKDKVATTCIACHDYHQSATLKMGTL